MTACPGRSLVAQETIIFYVIDGDRTTRVEIMRWVAERGGVGRPFQCGADFVEELPHLRPGIAFIDVENSGMNGFDLIETVARARLACPVIGILSEADIQVAVGCLKRGAIDVVVKPFSPGPLREAVAGAERLLEARRSLFEQAERDETALQRLSAREHEVLRAMAAGMTNRSIAERLALSVRTVEAYRAALVEKLETGSAAAAIALVVRRDTVVLAHAACPPAFAFSTALAA